MSSTAASVTTASYSDLGAGPLSAVVKSATRVQGGAWDKVLFYVGSSSPSDDTLSIEVSTEAGQYDYGGTDNVYAKSMNGAVTLIVVK